MNKKQKKLAVPSRLLSLRELTALELGKVEGGLGVLSTKDGSGRNMGGD